MDGVTRRGPSDGILQRPGPWRATDAENLARAKRSLGIHLRAGVGPAFNGS